VAFLVSLNFYGRHLNESHRSMVAAKVAKMPTHRPKKGANLLSAPEAAELLNVWPCSVKTAKKVEHDGAPGLVMAIDRRQCIHRLCLARTSVRKPL